tara:strand:+ start:1299 stop:1874 length:576 start_codon:yes stop_codon:yes gene_type:complete
VPITSLKFRPGINKETTSYSNKGGWNDCDLIRFRFGYPEKLGGWEKYSQVTFLGASRSLHSWANLEGNKYLGIGTEQKFYIEQSQGYNDITPLRRKVVNGVTVFDLGSGVVTSKVTGSAGTGAVGTVVVDRAQTVSVKSNNPVESLRILATASVGTVTIFTPPVTANLAMTSAVGTVTVSVNDLSISVGGS